MSSDETLKQMVSWIVDASRPYCDRMFRKPQRFSDRWPRAISTSAVSGCFELFKAEGSARR
jgi:hypothetical protein